MLKHFQKRIISNITKLSIIVLKNKYPGYKMIINTCSSSFNIKMIIKLLNYDVLQIKKTLDSRNINSYC